MPLQLSKLEISEEYILAWENSLNLISKLTNSQDIFIVRRTENTWEFIAETESFKSKKQYDSILNNLLFDKVAGFPSGLMIKAGENELIKELNILIGIKVLAFFWNSTFNAQ
jgi:hypothetical protein